MLQKILIKVKQHRKLHHSKISLSQFTSDAVIPASLVGDYSDYKPLRLSEKESTLLKTLHHLSLSTGYEYGQVLFNSGETDILTSHKNNMVKLPIDEIDDTGLRVYHSHTNDTPPSSQDLLPLTLPNVSQIGVVSKNGDIWIVRVDSIYRPSVTELRKTIQVIQDDIDMDILFSSYTSGYTAGELNYIRDAFRDKCNNVSSPFRSFFPFRS